jgi:hypothetical protein
VIQIWYLGEWLVLTGAWAISQLWGLAVAGVNAVWVFILLIIFVPIPRLILGAVLTVGGAFLPDITPRSKTGGTGAIEISDKKLLVRGAPRYAVCLVGILIVLFSLFQEQQGTSTAKATLISSPENQR